MYSRNFEIMEYEKINMLLNVSQLVVVLFFCMAMAVVAKVVIKATCKRKM